MFSVPIQQKPIMRLIIPLSQEFYSLSPYKRHGFIASSMLQLFNELDMDLYKAPEAPNPGEGNLSTESGERLRRIDHRVSDFKDCCLFFWPWHVHARFWAKICHFALTWESNFCSPFYIRFSQSLYTILGSSAISGTLTLGMNTVYPSSSQI